MDFHLPMAVTQSARGGRTPRAGRFRPVACWPTAAVSTAVNVLTRLDDNSFSWRSVNRTLGGVTLPDGETFILKRTSRR